MIGTDGKNRENAGSQPGKAPVQGTPLGNSFQPETSGMFNQAADID
jgi:hypothetical protein